MRNRKKQAPAHLHQVGKCWRRGRLKCTIPLHKHSEFEPCFKSKNVATTRLGRKVRVRVREVQRCKLEEHIKHVASCYVMEPTDYCRRASARR